MMSLHDLVPLFAAVLMGGVVGAERQLGGHGAGLRTHMMVSLAASLFLVASRDITSETGGDLTRVIQGIAAGVGFIGAGTILKLSSQHEVIGLTTASTIWLAAAVGTACGLGEYALAVCGTVISVVFLVAVRPLEDYFGRKAKKKPKHKSPDSKAEEQD